MNCLIKWMGGFTKEEVKSAIQKERDTQYRYYLNLRRVELVTDRQAAVKHHRTRSDIDRRLQVVTAELVGIEDKEEAIMSPELRIFLNS